MSDVIDRATSGVSELPGTYTRVFYHPADPLIFRDPRWFSVLIPYGINLEEIDATALCAAAAQAGDDTLTVTDIEPIPPHQATMRIPATSEGLQAVHLDSTLGHVDIRVLGDSGRWGGEVAHEGLLLLGGDDEFMTSLTALAGGVADLRRRYDRFIQDGWHEAPAAADRLRAAVRWPPAQA